MKALLPHLYAGLGALWALLLVVIAFVSFFSFLLPSGFKAVVDSLLPRGNQHQFHLFCTVMVVLVLARSVLNAMQDYLFLRVRQLLENGLLGRYFASVITMPVTRWSTLNEADLVNRISLVLTNFQTLLPELVYYFAYALCVSLAVTVVLFLLNPLFLAVSAVFLVLHVTNFFLHYRISLRFSSEVATGRGQVAGVYRDLLRGRKFITLAGLEQPTLDALDRDHRALYQASFRRDLVESGLALMQQLLHGMNYLTLAVVGALAIFQGSMSAGSMALSLLFIGFAYEPVYRLSKLTKSLSETEAELARVVPLLSEPAPRQEPVERGARIDRRIDGRIDRLELRALGFERAGAVLLRAADAVFTPDHVYLVTGPSGCGKTTLLHLIAGFLPATGGQVLWNGNAVGSLSRAELAGLITYSPQHSLLLDGTVRDNLTLFERAPSRERLASALHLAVADGFIDLERAERLEVENEGTNFSGGQKQRLHLARAWYHTAPVMLFDEPTANLDAETEELFFQRLVTQAPGRIIIVISHSPAARRYASKVLRFSSGTLEPVE